MTYWYEEEAKEPEKTKQQREFAILEEIKRQPRISHNNLKKILVERGDMAGKTFDKLITQLSSDRRIATEQDGNKKRYSIPSAKLNSNDFRKDIVTGASMTEYHMGRLRQEYSSLHAIDKAMTAMFAFKCCADTLRVISTASAFIKKPKGDIVIEKRIQEYIKEIAEIVSRDPDSDIVLPVLKANMLQDNTIRAMTHVLENIPPKPDEHYKNG